MTFGPCAGIYHRIAIPVFSSYLGEFSARMDRNVLGFLLALDRVCYPPVAALNGILPVFTIQKKRHQQTLARFPRSSFLQICADFFYFSDTFFALCSSFPKGRNLNLDPFPQI